MTPEKFLTISHAVWRAITLILLKTRRLPQPLLANIGNLAPTSTNPLTLRQIITNKARIDMVSCALFQRNAQGRHSGPWRQCRRRR